MPLQKLKYLHQLDLRDNALCEIDDYRELIIFLLPRLTLLDGIEVTPEDTVQGKGDFFDYITNCYNFLFLKLKKLFMKLFMI